MSDIELFYRVGLSLVIGLMIGAERGWHTRELSGGLRRAGIRTFTLVGLAGGLWALLGEIVGDIVLGLAFIGLAAIMIAAHLAAYNRAKGEFGTTTLVAIMVTFALGAIAVRGDMALAAAAAVVTMAVLQVKPELHRWVAAIGRFELNSLIKLLVISVVVLPILPNRGFGPAGLLNPFEMWWMVVLISLISFVGYFAIRILGPRLGTALTGLFGGLASSTAVTLNFSRFGRRDPTLIAALAGGVGFASTIMYLRVAVVATVVNSELGQRLWLPMLLAAGVSGIAALILSLQSEKLTDHRPPDIGDPTDIANALIFGVLLVGLTLLSHFLRQWAGDDALLMVAAAGGLVDVDAVTLTMSRMANGQLDAELLTSRLAVTAILIAVVTNTLVKASIVIAVCGGGMAWRTSAALGSGLIAALAGFWLF